MLVISVLCDTNPGGREESEEPCDASSEVSSPEQKSVLLLGRSSQGSERAT